MPRKMVKKPLLDAESIARAARDYKETKELQDQLSQRLSNLRKQILEYIDANGVEDDKGNVWVEIDDIDFSGQLKKERRTSQSLDTDGLIEWLKSIGVYEDYVEYVETLDEDKVLGAAWNGDLDRKKVESFYVHSETYALKLMS